MLVGVCCIDRGGVSDTTSIGTILIINGLLHLPLQGRAPEINRLRPQISLKVGAFRSASYSLDLPRFID